MTKLNSSKQEENVLQQGAKFCSRFLSKPGNSTNKRKLWPIEDMRDVILDFVAILITNFYNLKQISK